MTRSLLKAVAHRWAGLIRGAVSVALVYYYFDPKGQSEDSHRATLIATTLVVVMFSITVFGAVTKPLLDFTLGMGQGGRGSASLAAKTTHKALSLSGADAQNAHLHELWLCGIGVLSRQRQLCLVDSAHAVQAESQWSSVIPLTWRSSFRTMSTPAWTASALWRS